MKTTSFNNIMTLLLPLMAAVVLFFLANSVNAICCRFPGGACTHFAGTSCSPAQECPDCPPEPIGLIKADTLGELFEVERAGKRNVKGSLEKGDNDDLVKKTSVMNLGNTDEEGGLKKKATAEEPYVEVMEA